MNVYKCRVCNRLCGHQGVGSHMRRAHGINRSTDYGPDKDSRDYTLKKNLTVNHDGVRRHFAEGSVIAKYLFETSGVWHVDYKSGDHEAFLKWLPDRIAYLDRAYSNWRPRHRPCSNFTPRQRS